MPRVMTPESVAWAADGDLAAQRLRPCAPRDLVNIAPRTLAGDRLASQIAATPDALALVAVDRSFTYAEFGARVDELAGWLVRAGAGTGAPVGVAVDRTSDLVAVVWACLGLGVPYVPLDPAYPAARLAHMVRDSDVGLLVADATGRAAVDVDVPVLDPADAPSSTETVAAPAPSPSPDALAYVIYTSGSTGQPKGVQIDQANLAHFLDAMTVAVQRRTGGHDVFLASTTLSFDPSVVELVWALTTGFTVVLSPSLAGPVNRRASLGTLIERHAVTHAQLTPSRARVLLTDVDERRALARLTQVFLGGEILSPHLAAELLDAGVDTVTNLYGPTESTVWAFAHDVSGRAEAVRAGGPIPIGRPLPGYTFRVRDDGGGAVADGHVGELLIGGAGVSRGYRHRRELNRERFVDDVELGCAYRTGDLVRVRVDGVVDFVGRADDQVKIEGYRIELAEVERALSGAPGTLQVVVAAPGEADRRLVAYVVPAVGSQPSGRDLLDGLRAFGADLLPSYMLPTEAIVVDAFDLTPSGKVDRTKLPDPAVDVDVDAVARVGELGAVSSEDVQATLALWWAELLGRRRVRSDEDFFDLGGDSVMAVRLLARVHRSWGVRLGLATLVAAPTVQALAALVVTARHQSQGRAIGATPSLVPFVASASVDRAPAHGPRPLVVVHGAGGNVLNLTTMARHLAEVRPVVGIQAQGVDGVSEPDPSIDAMVDRYVRELLAYQPEGPYLLGGYSGGGLVAIEMARRLGALGSSVPVVLLFDTYPPGTDEPDMIGKCVNVVRNVVHHGPLKVMRSLAVIAARRLSGRVVADQEALGYGDVTELGLAQVDQHFNRAARAHPFTRADVKTVLFRAEIIQASLPPRSHWEQLLTRPPTERTVPGHHYSMFDAVHAGALAAAVEDVLASSVG